MCLAHAPCVAQVFQPASARCFPASWLLILILILMNLILIFPLPPVALSPIGLRQTAVVERQKSTCQHPYALMSGYEHLRALSRGPPNPLCRFLTRIASKPIRPQVFCPVPMPFQPE